MSSVANDFIASYFAHNRLRRRKENLIAEGIINYTKTGVAAPANSNNGANVPASLASSAVPPRLTSDALDQVCILCVWVCIVSVLVQKRCARASATATAAAISVASCLLQSHH